MKNLFILFLFSIIEYIITIIITNSINAVNCNYISLKYTSFKFYTSKDTPTGLNIIIKIFGPPIYIIIFSGILYELNFNNLVNNIYIVTLFYYVIKWLILIILLNRTFLIDWKNEFSCFFI